MTIEIDFIRYTKFSPEETQEEPTNNPLIEYLKLLHRIDPYRVPAEMLKPGFVDEFMGTGKIEFALSTNHLSTKIHIFWAKKLLKVEHWGASELHILIDYINQKGNDEFIEMNYPPVVFRPHLVQSNGLYKAETAYKINFVGPVVLESARQEIPTIIACTDENYTEGHQINTAEIFIMAEQINLHYRNKYNLAKPPFMPLILATKTV